ncbi:MAG: hypothetical protein OQK04_03865, partial [Kangiellaceae bacterium]|nr:hypothetical protein [Kangiellaceae bacterium]
MVWLMKTIKNIIILNQNNDFVASYLEADIFVASNQPTIPILRELIFTIQQLTRKFQAEIWL